MQGLEEILEEIRKAFEENTEYIADEDGCHHFVIDGCTATYLVNQIIRKHMNDGWIPVEERLPDNNENVLVTTDMGLIASGYIAHGTWITDQEPDYPIAWRPLPEPYQAERSET